MTICNFSETCSFFKNETIVDPDIKNIFINKYCKNSYTACARYHVALSHGMENVPDTIWPDIFICAK